MRNHIKAGIATSILAAITLTGCAGEPTPAATPKATEPTATAAPKATEPTITPADQMPTGTGSTGAKETEVFDGKADAVLVATEMRDFTLAALAHPGLYAGTTPLPEAIESLALTGEAEAYLKASPKQAAEVMALSWATAPGIAPGTVRHPANAATVVNPDDITVESWYATFRGQDALVAEWDATVQVKVQQKTTDGTWGPVETWVGDRHFEVTLIENPAPAENTSVWVVADWETNAIRFNQTAGE